jgi:hypothetical protein
LLFLIKIPLFVLHLSSLKLQKKDITKLVKQPNIDSKTLKLKRNLLCKRGRPYKELADFAINYKHFLQLDANVKQFIESRHAKVLRLIAKDIFKITPKSEVLRGSCIFNSKFVDKVKNKGTKKAFAKSRLVV